PAPDAIAADRSLLPFVGRAAELSCLLDAWRQHGEQGEQDNGGRVMLVAGEAGIGKTRLAQEFLRQVRDEGTGVLVARCFEGESHLAYGPLAMALRGGLARDGASW